MHIDLKQVRAFFMVAKLGSLTRASEVVHLTQPALSLQLKALQEAVGTPLFKRTAQGMELLPAGTDLLPYAESVLAASTDFQAAASRLSQQLAGNLSLGTILDPDFLRLGSLLSLMLERHPSIHIDVSHGISGVVLSQVLEGSLDLGFYLGVPDDKRLHVTVLTPFNYRVVAPKAWKDKVAKAEWRSLAKLPWIWTPPESVHNRLLSAEFERIGATPRIAAQVDVEPSMLDLVKAGVGLSLLREAVARRASRARHVVLTKTLIGTELTLVCLKRRLADPAIAATFELITELWCEPA